MNPTMLTIKRVPTVVSNYQEDGNVPAGAGGEMAASAAVGCGRNCLGRCCLSASNLPIYGFKSDPKPAMSSSSDAEELLPPGFFLDTLLLGQWEERMSRGLFRYNVAACETKVIAGPCGFIAQLNEGRHLKKRPTEFRVDCVLQQFDPAKFNFTKVGQEEALFLFEPGCGNNSYFSTAAPAGGASAPNVVAINVSPIEYGHVLLVPRVFDCLPQRIDPESLLLAIHMASEAANPYFRLGYNSLGAFATINHLHFQAYYLSLLFPVEKAATVNIPLAGTEQNTGVKVSKLINYPVRGLVFEVGTSMKEFADLVAAACICLQDNNIPYNFLISDSGKKIFLFPQCYAEKQALGEVSQELLDTQVNPAVWEISGHIVLKRKEDYEEASERSAWRLLAEVSLSEERFLEVKAIIFEATGLVENTEDINYETEVPCERSSQHSRLPAAATAAPHIPEGCMVRQ